MFLCHLLGETVFPRWNRMSRTPTGVDSVGIGNAPCDCHAYQEDSKPRKKTRDRPFPSGPKSSRGVEDLVGMGVGGGARSTGENVPAFMRVEIPKYIS
jgi:hypothetical protein